ncbi:MAG: redoxin family protein [Gemmataceae bacterium]|nr:redoxin family protein [Gemmataceae bacterium]
MQTLRWSLGTLIVLGAVAIGHTEPTEAKVEIKVVKFAGLAQAVRERAGKVVVVDFWADFCIPCKKRFPHLVEMANKYKDQGLAVISVSVDADPHKKEVQDTALKFLQNRKATFLNLMLDEPPEYWSQRLGIKEIPCVFVFNRDGRWVRLGGEDVSSEDVEKLVVEWLKQK